MLWEGALGVAGVHLCWTFAAGRALAILEASLPFLRCMI